MPGQNPRDDEDLERLKWFREPPTPTDCLREAERLDAEIAAMEEPSQEEIEVIVAAKQEYDERAAYQRGYKDGRNHEREGTGPPSWLVIRSVYKTSATDSDRGVLSATKQFGHDANAARSVVSFWDSLDAVTGDDPKPTEDFAAEMDRRINALREELEKAEATRRPG